MSMRQVKPNSQADDGSSPPALEKKSNDNDFDSNQIARLNHENPPLTANSSVPFPACPSKLVSFLTTYNKFAGNTFTADQGIKLLQWSSWAVAYVTQSHSTYKNLSPSLRKLYFDLSMTRYALRVYGLLQSLEGYISGSWAGGNWDNPLIGKIAKYVMAGSMIIYHPLELVAYAGWQMPKLIRVDANRYSAVSCRFWTAYIVGDFWASCLKWVEMKKKLSSLGELLAGKKKDDDKDAVGEIQEKQQFLVKKIRHVKLQILRCLLFILPAFNWSLSKWATDPLLSEPVVNGLMLAEAYTCIYQSIRGLLD